MFYDIIMKKIVLVTILCASIAALFACSRTPSARKVVQAYQAAINSGSVDSLVALFSSDARVEYVGMAPPLWGSEALRGRAEYDRALNAAFTIAISSTHRDTVFAAVSENNDWLKKAGLQPNEYSIFYFVVRAGKITNIHAELSETSINQLNVIMSELIPWAMQNKPDEFEKLNSDSYMFNAQNARLSMEILDAWSQIRNL